MSGVNPALALQQLRARLKKANAIDEHLKTVEFVSRTAPVSVKLRGDGYPLHWSVSAEEYSYEDVMEALRDAWQQVEDYRRAKVKEVVPDLEQVLK